jgi:hypothetical protein
VIASCALIGALITLTGEAITVVPGVLVVIWVVVAGHDGINIIRRAVDVLAVLAVVVYADFIAVAEEAIVAVLVIEALAVCEVHALAACVTEVGRGLVLVVAVLVSVALSVADTLDAEVGELVLNAAAGRVAVTIGVAYTEPEAVALSHALVAEVVVEGAWLLAFL